MNGAFKEDVIDITGSSEKIAPATPLGEMSIRQGKRETVLWPKRYIYSYNDFSNATRDQRDYYFYFRDCFLRRSPIDIRGNTNYAFILLFDLLQEYDKHCNISRLQDELTTVGKIYPVTAVYAKNELVRRLQEKTRVTIADKYPQVKTQAPVQPAAPPNYPPLEYVPGYLLTGAKFKGKIAMSDAEEKILNNLYYGTNTFFSNDFCQQVIVSVFLQLLRGLTNQLTTDNKTLNDEYIAIADLIARKHYHYRAGSENYNYCTKSAHNDIRVLLMKHCENAVREQYGFKRRLSLQSQYSNPEIQSALETRLFNPANQLLQSLVKNCPLPDEPTDIYLNKQNTTRWKAQLDDLKAIYKVEKDGNAFLQKVLYLTKRNKGNPSIEHIFFESSKFIGKDNKAVCLSLYAHYIFFDQRSQKVDDKSLNKTLLKSLFSSLDQEQDFERIILQLKTDKNLQMALTSIAGLFEVKRKKIRLNDALIEEAETAYTETVELLNDYLIDEQEPEDTIQQRSGALASEPIPLAKVSRAADQQDAGGSETYHTVLQLNPLQQALLGLFSKHNLLLSASDLEDFAKEKGAFKNQLIDSINEACYETIDDVLIEEEDDNYLIQEHYFKRVLQT